MEEVEPTAFVTGELGEDIFCSLWMDFSDVLPSMFDLELLVVL